jgi:hypothetical protein
MSVDPSYRDVYDRVRGGSVTFALVVLVGIALAGGGLAPVAVADVDLDVDAHDEGSGEDVRPSSTASTPVAGGSSARPQLRNETNATQHVDPERVREEGNLPAVEGWLADSLVDRLSESTLRLSRGEYDRARRVVGEGYDDRLGQFVDVAGETPGNDDAGRTFERRKERQREYTDAVESYRETYNEYERARANDDTRRARRLGRELERQAGRVEETAPDLTRLYDNLSATTDEGDDLVAASQTVATIRANVTERQAAVSETLFVQTQVSATAEDPEIAYIDPLSVTGRLVAENGTALAGRTVRIRVANRTVRTTTDPTGTFEVRYRPIRLPLDTEAVTVEFVPRATGAFLPSNASVPVRVRQVTPTLGLSDLPETVRYGDRVTVSGQVSVSGETVTGVPVVVSVGGRRLGRTQTTATGYDARLRLPATVPTGDRSVAVELPFSGRAIAGANATGRVRVVASDTRLELEAAPTASGDRLTVGGTLRTNNGVPVRDQGVTVRLQGTRLGTVRTDAEGRFGERLTVPRQLRPENRSREVTLSGAFDGTANLNATDAEVVVRLSHSAEGGSGSGSGSGESGSGADADAPGGATGSFPRGGVPTWAWAVGMVTLAGLAAGGYVLAGRVAAAGVLPAFSVPGTDPTVGGGGDDGSAGENETSTTAAGAGTGTRTGNGESKATGTDPLASSRDRLVEGATDEAVERAFVSVRTELSRVLGVENTGTHREFRAAVEGRLDADRAAAIGTLTETYERAAFAPTAVDEDAAEKALDAATTVLEATD